MAAISNFGLIASVNQTAIFEDGEMSYSDLTLSGNLVRLRPVKS